MATSTNSNLISNQPGVWFPAIDTTVNSGAINAGDLVYDTGAGLVASFAAGLTLTTTLLGNLLNRLGVSNDTSPLKGGISNPLINVKVQGVGRFGFNGTAGDTYNQGDEVTIGVDAQTVVKTATLVQAAPTAANAGSGGSWAAAAHTAQVAIVSKLGISAPSAAASVTTTSGQYITVTPAAALPSWALAFAVFIDGLLAGYQLSASATNYLGPSANPEVPPKSDALAIGCVDLMSGTSAAPASVTSGTLASGIAGGVVPVRLYPSNGRGRAGLY